MANVAPKPEGSATRAVGPRFLDGASGGAKTRAMTRYGQQFGPDFTFLGVPRCDLDDASTYAGADVVILGAPFDGGTSHRPGTRFGPQAIRMTDYLPHDGSRPSLALRTDGLVDLDVRDAGDVEMYSGDIEVALPALEAAVEKVARAGAIVTLPPTSSDYYTSRGAAPDSVYWVPNGVYLPDLPPVRELPNNERFTVIFAGIHGVANGLDTVLDAAALFEVAAGLVCARWLRAGARRQIGRRAGDEVEAPGHGGQGTQVAGDDRAARLGAVPRDRAPSQGDACRLRLDAETARCREAPRQQQQHGADAATEIQ